MDPDDQNHQPCTGRGHHRSLALWVLLAWPAFAGASEPLFESSAVLDVHLAGPLQSVQDDLELRREQAFTLGVEGERHDIEVRVRGNSRTRVCRFPPLRLDFPRQETADGVFAGIDKIKLVTHCRAGNSAAADLLEEYTAYRLFNALTDQSIRVRLLRMHYTDTGESGGAPLVGHAFVLEPDDVLADRLGWMEVDRATVRRSDFEPVHAALVYIFQYMIGNTDWSLVTADTDEFCCHNGRLFEGAGRLFYLPYDFDLSGLVDARYAKPDAGLRIRNVRQRLYRGYCVEAGALAQALDIVIARREVVMATVTEIGELDDRSRSSIIQYLEDFYDDAADRQDLLAGFETRCL